MSIANLIASTGFIGTRINAAGNSNTALAQTANGLRAASAGAEAASEVANVASGNLKNIAKSVTQNCSDDAMRYMGTTFKAVKGLGVAGNALYLGAKVAEKDSLSDGLIVGSCGLTGMYVAEKAFEKSFDAISHMKFNSSEISGIKKVLTKLSKCNIKGIPGQVLKGVAFVAASCIGMNAAVKLGEAIIEN